jgi:hypothetical protein
MISDRQARKVIELMQSEPTKANAAAKVGREQENQRGRGPARPSERHHRAELGNLSTRTVEENPKSERDKSRPMRKAPGSPQ